MSISSKKSLTVFKLVMMAVVAIDSLKNLPANAQYGSSLLFYYLIAVLTFFIPSALVSAELATSLPQTGGVYIWVREAFGKRMAFMTVWIQWMVAIIWYPTILSFIAVTLSYLINPAWAENNLYILTSMLLLFWLATFLICQGISISSQISTVSAIIGVIAPMAFITFLGLMWLGMGNPSHLHIALTSLNEMSTSHDLRLFITLLYSLMGMEMIASHAGDVKNPQKHYPRALLISAFIILATVIPASLAIAIVIPNEKIGLTTGVIESFIIFLNAFHLEWIKPWVIVVMVIGSFGIFYTWLLNSSRCLLVAAQDGCLPSFFQKTNQKNMPTTQLLIQGLVFTFISSVFILMPSVNVAFWFLTVACAQLALIYYLFIFSSALYLRHKKPDLPRPFKVGKHPFVLWIVSLIAMITCVTSILFGFLPPPEINREQLFFYESLLLLVIIASCAIAILPSKSYQSI